METTAGKSSASSLQVSPLGQVICFVSAKGGTGKTVLSASAAYCLLRSGMRILAIDADFSTRGLSLFLLGSVLQSQERNVESKNCLADSILESIDVKDVTPLLVVHGMVEYNVIISNKDMWRGGVPDEHFLTAPGVSSGNTSTPSQYFSYLKRLCERFRKEYDYIIIDTRGGYDFTSAAPATIADGYVIVLEADKVSVEQVSGFTKKMNAYARAIDAGDTKNTEAFLKGFIVNKALFSVDDIVFPSALAREYDSKTFGVIPLDKNVIRAYQQKNIPLEQFPDSDFSYHSLNAIQHMVSPRLNWGPRGNTKQFYRFLSSVESKWAARRRIEFAQQLIPLFLIVLAAVSYVLYFFFKKGSYPNALSAFYISSAAFILISIAGSMLGTLSLLRTQNARKGVRYTLAFTFLLSFLAISYLTGFDIPRTFSQNPLLQRIGERDKTIDSQTEELNRLKNQVSEIQTEEQFLRADRAQAVESLNQTQSQMQDLQNQLANLKTQVSSIKRDRDTAQSSLLNAEQRATVAQRLLDECQRRPR